MATLSFGPLICVNLTLVGTLVVIPFPKNVQLMTSGISGGEKAWASFCLLLIIFLYIYLCVHSHVHVYTMHCVDIETKRGEIKKGQIPYTGMYWRDQRIQAFRDCVGVIRLVVTAVICLLHVCGVIAG